VIVAAGLTPAWQQVMTFDALEPGAVNRARDVVWCSSGKVLNVAIALSRLGAAVETVALVGGPAAEFLEAEFAGLGIPRRWVAAQAPTRICTTILETGIPDTGVLQAGGRTTELVENAGPVTAGELDEFRRVFGRAAAGADLVVLSGSLPQGAPSDYYRQLLEQTDCRAIVDARGPELLESLARRPFLVKPNRQELAHTLGRPVADDAALRAAMQELNDRGATWVVVTAGSDPLWASSAGHFFRLRPPAVRVINPIGSGDSMAAAIAWGIRQGNDPLQAIRLGVAAGAENAAQKLPGRLDPAAVAERADAVAVDAL
jgi:1-phosphofructokinase family hexose kinase